MKLVTMHEAKTHLSRLVDFALAGGEVVIARRKQPLVRLSVVAPQKSPREIGALSGLVRSMGDGFNDSMDDWSEPLVAAVPPPRPRKKKASAR